MPEKQRVLILPGWPPQLSTWRHIVRQRLPFRADWGSPTHRLEEAGHINADTGLDDWPQGLAWLHALQSDEP